MLVPLYSKNITVAFAMIDLVDYDKVNHCRWRLDSAGYVVKWAAYYKINGRMYSLGRFDSEEEAAQIATAHRLERLSHATD